MGTPVCQDDSVSRRILTHLERLEAESVHIFREVVAEAVPRPSPDTHRFQVSLAARIRAARWRKSPVFTLALPVSRRSPSQKNNTRRGTL